MASVWTMGELLCEIMRPEADMNLYDAGVFRGPYPSGAPGIFIDTVARLGHNAGIVGGVGKDDFGKCIIDRLKKNNVDCTHVTEYEDGATGVAFVTYFYDGSRKFLFHFPETPATRPKAPNPSSLASDVKYFHIMGCSLMATHEFGQEILKLMNGLVERGATVTFDPNVRLELLKDEGAKKIIEEVMKHASILFPGESELLMVSGEKTTESAVETCFKNPKLEIIVLKRGAQGCSVYTRNESFSLDSFKVKAVDSTGAGDCFDGAFLAGLLDGKSLKDASKFALAAGALNVMAFGPMEGDISKQSIEKLIASQNVEPVSI